FEPEKLEKVETENDESAEEQEQPEPEEELEEVEETENEEEDEQEFSFENAEGSHINEKAENNEEFDLKFENEMSSENLSSTEAHLKELNLENEIHQSLMVHPEKILSESHKQLKEVQQKLAIFQKKLQQNENLALETLQINHRQLIQEYKTQYQFHQELVD